jgi:hypothetical protein
MIIEINQEKKWVLLVLMTQSNLEQIPVPMALRSKVQVFDRSSAEIVGSNPTQGMDVFLLWVLCVVR